MLDAFYKIKAQVQGAGKCGEQEGRLMFQNWGPGES